MMAVLATAVVQSKAQTILNYGTFGVSKEEFLKAYNKNKTPITDKEKAVRDYVDLYANFKMKVKEAQLMKLDTLEQLKTDLNNFRHQIEENYLSDERSFNTLMQEAFQRSQWDVHLIRYTMTMEENDDPEDTLRRYQDVQQFYQQLKSNKPGDEIVMPIDIKLVDMGFVTVFTLPYTIENIAYGLKPGQISAPYRGKKAWHIFQLKEKRKGAGKWKVAQILFTSPDNADDATKARAQQLADSVYQLIQNGTDFNYLARTFSDDKLTYLNGGEMPEFGTGKYDYSFEKEVTQLQQDGAISTPFTTPFGWHIVKRLSHTEIPDSFSDDALQFELRQKIMQDDRVKIAKDKFAADIIGKIGFKVNNLIKQEDLFRYVDTVMLDPEASAAYTESPISKKAVIFFSKGNVKGEDWLNFARDYKMNGEVYKGETNEEIWEKYKTVASIDYYRKHLEEYSADFKYQMQEFREGNLLFEIMERKVWSKASADTAGLRQHYEANAAQYKWAASADVLILNAVSEKLANEALDSLKAGSDWHHLVDVHQGELQGDSARFELTQINGVETAAPGSFSIVVRNADGTATLIRYYRHYPSGEQRSFEDARGMVINDYQNELEKKWLAALKKKYPVRVNEVILKQVIKEIK